MVDRFQVGSRQTRLTEYVVDVVTIALVCRHATGGSVRLFGKTRVFELSHHVPDRGRTPAVAMRKTVGEHTRADRLAGHEVFFDQSSEKHFGARIECALLSTLQIC